MTQPPSGSAGDGLLAAGRDAPRGAIRASRPWALRAAVLLLRYGILVLLSIIFFGPWLFLLSMSLKTPDVVLAYPPEWAPQPLYWQNYAIALTHIPYLLYLRNTLFLVAVTVVGQLLSCSLVAYSLACVDWPGRNRLLVLILATLMLPAQVTLIPVYIIFSKLHWVNTFLPLTIPAFFGNATYIFLLRQFFLSVSREVSEAGRLDGAGDLGIYWRIILPIARPALITVAVLTATGTYNDFFGPLIYLTDSSLWTLALGLNGFIGTRGSDLGALMAATIFYALPAVALFVGAQRLYLRGLVVQNFERV